MADSVTVQAQRSARSGAGSKPSPVAAREVGATRVPLEQAHLLPPRVFHDPEIYEYEQTNWYEPAWLCVGREEDAAGPGGYFLCAINGENLIVVRGTDGELRAFFNVCRHRGATIVTEPCGEVVRFQCPYHAWIYDLDGTLRTPRYTDRLENFDLGGVGSGARPPGDLAGLHLPEPRRRARRRWRTPSTTCRPTSPASIWPSCAGRKRIDYDVAANWKAIVENYSECYHCPGVHPQLNQITPYNLGGWISTRRGRGPAAGWR